MAECKDTIEESDSFLKEELSHVEELLISSREECIDISSKFQDLSQKVEEIIQLQENNSDDECASDEHSDVQQEQKAEIDEQLFRYERQIATYQSSQEYQARIVQDLQNRVEEYRMRCAKLEAALAEHAANEASFTDSDSHSQNAFTMDIETALIRLEQEKNRCQGLQQINTLLREQLETATEVNQTLTSDVHRLTKEWQHARSELLAKESEWKEEEQTFSLYFTKESNILLSMWRQILNFRHDFANLRNSTERELASFKICICHNIKNMENIQVISENLPSIEEESSLKNNEKLEERIHALIDRNDRIQQLLDVNSTLCSTVDKMNTSLKNKMQESASEVRNVEIERLFQEYSNALRNMSEILIDDPNCEVPMQLALPKFENFRIENIEKTFVEENSLQLQSLVKAIRKAFHKYRNQAEDAKLKVASMKEQNSMQQRTVEFLEDERQKMQQLNSQLSSQFETLNLKIQNFLKDDFKNRDVSEDKTTSCLETLIKSLNEQIESLHADRGHLLEVQEEMKSKLQDCNSEKISLKLSEQNLSLELNRSSSKIEMLEKSLDAVRKDFQDAQETLHQVTLDKELLEQEKENFEIVLSNLEKQCSDLKNCLEKLRDEENVVRESLISVQNLNESLSMEKSHLSKLLAEATSEIEALKANKSCSKFEIEKEQKELKRKMQDLNDRCSELETEKGNLLLKLQEIELAKSNFEEEKDQLITSNNDLSNQITKFTTQKKNFEAEIEQLREELKQHMELVEQVNEENNALTRSKSELSLKLDTIQTEMVQMNEIISALREEKAFLEKSLYSCQKSSGDVHDEKSDLVRELDFQKSSVASLQAQIKELQELHQAYIDDVAKEKDAVMMKMNKIEHEFQITLRNERNQHNVDIDILTQEKEALRGRLVSVVDECFDTQQKRLDEVQSSHQEEIAALKKKFSLLENEHEGKLLSLEEEKKRVDADNKFKVEALEHTIIGLKKELNEKEIIVSALEERVTVADREKQKVLQEKLQAQQNLKDEINNMLLEHSKAIKDLENQVQDLKQQKETAAQDLQNLEIKLKNSELEKDKIAAELDEISSLSKNEKNSRVQLEDKIALLQNQLLDEKSLNEVISRSLEDCKNRLKGTQAENIEFKRQIEETNQEMNDIVSFNNKLQSQNAEFKTTLRDVEKSRQEMKRDIQNLQRKIQSLEQELSSKEYEITELNILQGRQEEKEEELKKEIVSLKQKVLESNASNVAAAKEMAQSKQKLSGLEHKLKMQEEQHHSVLEECLSNEQNLSEHRLNLEKSVADATKEIQILRSRLSSEEGKVAALECRVIKLDGSKREVENKMYSLCLFLRTCLGIGSDSGFSSSASNLLLSPWPSQKDKHNSSRSSVKDSPHRLNFSSSSTPAQLTISDSDIELLKSTLMDLIEKFHTIEKEKDDLKDALSGLQKQDEELRNEHSRCIAKVYQLKRDLEDKKNVEKDLATKIASIHHHEEVICTLEREKRRLTEKIGNAEFSLAALEKEKENLLEKMNEMRKVEDDLRTVSSAKETAESKALKYFKMYQNFERDIAVLNETLNNKNLEIKLLEQNIEAGKKKLQACEDRNKYLHSTIEQLNLAIESHIDSERTLKEKVHSLSHSLSRNSASQQNLNDEYESAGKERMRYQKEIIAMQSTLDKLKSTAEEFKLKNRILNDELENMRKNLRMSESAKEEFSDQIKRLQNVLVKTKDSEKEALDQVDRLREQKKNLEKKISELSASLREAKDMYYIKQELCEKLEMEVDVLRKDLDKIEKEKQMTSDLTTKSLIEKSSLGRSLTKLEIENQALQLKVQNLQAQLAELEERHAQRVKDFLDSQRLESKLEDERIKRASKHTQQLMEAKEKTHHQKVSGLEEKIKVLTEHLEKEKQKWQRYHARSLNTDANISYLHSVLSKSLQNVSDDPQKLLPEAERLDLTTEIQLNASGASISTPSKLSRTPTFIHHRTSTPRSRRKLDLSKT